MHVSYTPLSSISMVAYGAVDFIPHFGELPFRDAAFVVDEVVIELDAEPRPVEIALQDDVALRHHKRLLNVALPHWAALHIGWPSLNGLKRRHLMGEQVRDRRGYVHRRGEADHSFLGMRQHVGVEGL